MPVALQSNLPWDAEATAAAAAAATAAATADRHMAWAEHVRDVWLRVPECALPGVLPLPSRRRHLLQQRARCQSRCRSMWFMVHT